MPIDIVKANFTKYLILSKKKIKMKSFTISTSKRSEAIRINDKVEELIDIEEGICLVYVLHTSCGITINEMDNLEIDIPNFLDKLVPNSKEFVHENGMGNADSHIKATLIGSNVNVPVHEGKLVLGTWQNIMLMDFDGPRTRKIIVQTVGK